MEIKYKKIHPNAHEPRRMHPGDAGADLVAITYDIDDYTGIKTYHTGLAFEIPEGYVGLLFPRSSVYKTGMQMCNCVGVIDSNYRGEVTAKFYDNAKEQEQRWWEGERVVQLIIMPYPIVTFVEAEDLSVTDRGTGGYGSTGR